MKSRRLDGQPPKKLRKFFNFGDPQIFVAKLIGCILVIAYLSFFEPILVLTWNPPRQ